MSKTMTVFPGMTTPWGRADYTAQLCPGIGTVGTPSHGGIKVSAALNKRVPEIVRAPGGWYEEDCAWCVPFIVFRVDLLAAGDEHTVKLIHSEQAVGTLKRWFTAGEVAALVA